MSPELPEALAAYAVRCDSVLDAILPAADSPPHRLHAAIRYAMLGGGKRIRPLLVYTVGRAFGAVLESLDHAAAAVEMIHAYSLIHDDLPSMDDDDLRRGRPTCHRAFDEATAILAGDALQCLAFETLVAGPGDASVRLAMISSLASASGVGGMAGGQAMDLGAIGQHLDLPALESMHRLKTGALIRASVRLGALAAGAGDSVAQALDTFADRLGLAFQIRDDILDVEGSVRQLGKSVGKDARADKPTYATLLGIEGAKRRLAEEMARIEASVAGMHADARTMLGELARFVVERRH